MCHRLGLPAADEALLPLVEHFLCKIFCLRLFQISIILNLAPVLVVNLTHMPLDTARAAKSHQEKKEEHLRGYVLCTEIYKCILNATRICNGGKPL